MHVKVMPILAPLLFMAGGAQAVTVDPLVQVDGSSNWPIIVNSVRTADGEVVPNEEWSSYISPRAFGGFEGIVDISVYDRDGNFVDDLADIVSFPGGDEFGSLPALYFYLYDDHFFGSFYWSNDIGAVYYDYSNISLTDIIVNFTIGAEAGLSWAVDYPGFQGSVRAESYIGAGGSAQGCEGVSAGIDAQLFDGSSGSDAVSHSHTFDVLLAPGDFCEFALFGGQVMGAEWSPIDGPVPIPLPSPMLMLASALGLALGGSARLRRKEI